MGKKRRGLTAASCFLCAGLAAFAYIQEEAPYIRSRLAAEKLEAACVKPLEEGEAQAAQGVPRTGAPLTVDFEALKAMNPDIVGWIRIPGTRISYPILQHPSKDAYYLTHDPEKKEDKLGAIYLHHDADAGFRDAHTIVFGHNMKSGQMFGDLHLYEEEDFFRTHPEVDICLPDGTLHGTVYSAYVCGTDDLTYTTGYRRGGERYQGFIRHTVESSLFQAEEAPSDRDRIVTLSTCAKGGSAEKRFVVNCMIKEGKEKRD